jgi:hypothetical protein
MEAPMYKKHTIINSEFGHLQCQIDENKCVFLHLTLKKWSHTLYKQYLILFYSWLNTLSEKGVLAVFVLIPDNDPKLYKFEQMFGFKEIDRKHGQILMAKETGE